jgi:hypothetical protein
MTSYNFNVINDQIIINKVFIKKDNYLNLAIMINCNDTLDNNFLYKIQTINLI